MKRITLIAGLLICLATPLFSQDDADGPEVKVPKAVVKQVVRQIVAWYFKGAKKPKTIYFAAENIKKEWLPKLTNINFVVLEKPERYPYKRKVYYFEEVERSGHSFRINFAYGDRGCHALRDADAGDTWSFRAKGLIAFALKPVWMNWRGICAG